MSSQIELELFETLKLACNQDPGLMKIAEHKLGCWEKEPNYYTTLLGFFSNYQLDESIRLMAMISFKNGIDKYWRKNQKE